jgi:hypothetical protein
MYLLLGFKNAVWLGLYFYRTAAGCAFGPERQTSSKSSGERPRCGVSRTKPAGGDSSGSPSCRDTRSPGFGAAARSSGNPPQVADGFNPRKLPGAGSSPQRPTSPSGAAVALMASHHTAQPRRKSASLSYLDLDRAPTFRTFRGVATE